MFYYYSVLLGIEKGMVHIEFFMIKLTGYILSIKLNSSTTATFLKGAYD